MRRKTNMRPRYHRWQDDLRPAKPVREATNKILEMVDEGLLNPRDVLLMALKWMSEDDVKAMAEANELFEEDEEDAED
jgi:hypothetical protein